MADQLDMDERVHQVLRGVLEIGNNRIEPSIDLRVIGLNSLNAIHLVVGIENEFDIEFDDHELVISNFDSIEKIKTMIGEKQNERKEDHGGLE